MTEIDLVRDVLDTGVLDRHGEVMGKVDGIVLELSEDGTMRVAYLEIDVAEGWRRLSPRVAGWMASIERLWRGAEVTYRVPWSQVRGVGIDVELDVDARETPVFELERWLRRFIRRIPGSQ
jgi:sporulation protein YlmC with PRC-barrel domain